MVIHSYRHKLTLVITSLAVMLVIVCVSFYYWYTYRIVMSEMSRNLKNSAEMIRLALTDEDIERIKRLHAILSPYIHYNAKEIASLEHGGIINNIPPKVIALIESDKDFKYLVNKLRRLALASGTSINSKPPKYDSTILKKYVADGVVVPYLVVFDKKYIEYPMSQSIVAVHYKTNKDFMGNSPGTTWMSSVPRDKLFQYAVYVNNQLYKDLFYTAIYSSTALYDKNGHIAAFLGLDYPAGGEIDKLTNLGKVSFLLILLSLVSGFVISYYMSKKLSGSLVKLTDAAGDIAKNNYNVTVNIDEQDEFGKLAGAFNEMASAVKNTTDELKKTNERLISITADMHDGAGAVLTSILIASKNPETKLADINAMAKNGVSEIRFLMDAIEFDICNYGYMTEGLELLAVDILKPNNIVWHFEKSGDNDRDIPFQMYLDIQRIVRECFANIIKHSDAKECRISINMDGDNIMLTVENDGKSLDVSKAVSGGRGLKNIAFRAGKYDGHMSYDKDDFRFCVYVDLNIPNL